MRFRFSSSKEQSKDKFIPAWYCCDDQNHSMGQLISTSWTNHLDDEVLVEISLDVLAIIVIEKEGIFHRLAEDQFYKYIPYYLYYIFNIKYIIYFSQFPSIMICGCGKLIVNKSFRL
jgi:hypothetical protein